MNKKEIYNSKNTTLSNYNLSDNNKNEKVREDFFGNLINKNKKHKISFSDKVKQTIQIAEEIEINRKLSVIEDKEEYNKKNIQIDPFETQGTIYKLKHFHLIKDNLSDSSEEEEINEKKNEIDDDKVNLPCQSCLIF